jgi:hypothetical protein
MMPTGSVVVVAVVELVVARRSGAETRRVIHTLVFVCHYGRRKRRNRKVLLSLWRLMYAAVASRWVLLLLLLHNGGYGMAKDVVEMRIWRHSSKGQVA